MWTGLLGFQQSIEKNISGVAERDCTGKLTKVIVNTFLLKSVIGTRVKWRQECMSDGPGVNQ